MSNGLDERGRSVILRGARHLRCVRGLILVRILAVAGGIAATTAQAQLSSGPLVIESATPDAGSETLTIAGANFGPRPFVTLDLIPMNVQLAIASRIVVGVPVGAMPPGSYLLTVSRGSGPGESASFDVALHGGSSGSPTTAGASPAAAAVNPPAVIVPSHSGTDVAATVGDSAITVADVDREWQRTDPTGYLAVMRQLDGQRRRVANQLVAQALIAREAAARGVTTEALLAEELPTRTIAMPDAAVTSLYTSLGDRTRGASLEQLRPALRAWLAKHTEPEIARMNYVEELMKTSTRADVVLPSLVTQVSLTANDPALGPVDAPITLVAFGDLQSNEYVRLAQTFARARETYGNRLRIVFKHLPTFGGPSVEVAQAAACAHDGGKFWPYHDAAMKPGTIDRARVMALAKDVGFDVKAFESCLEREDIKALPRRALAEAARYGLTSSPALLVNGRLAPEPPAFLPPFEFLTRLIEEELQRQARAAAR